MKTLFIYLIALLLTSGSLLSCDQKGKSTSDTASEMTQAKVSLISPEKLNEELGSIQLIDVRTPEEFGEGHLENSRNMNYYDDDFKQQLSVLDKNQKVYVYCKKGGRSANAAELLSEMVFTEIYDLEGGIDNWKDKGLKTVK